MEHLKNNKLSREYTGHFVLDIRSGEIYVFWNNLFNNVQESCVLNFEKPYLIRSSNKISKSNKYIKLEIAIKYLLKKNIENENENMFLAQPVVKIFIEHANVWFLLSKNENDLRLLGNPKNLVPLFEPISEKSEQEVSNYSDSPFKKGQIIDLNTLDKKKNTLSIEDQNKFFRKYDKCAKDLEKLALEKKTEYICFLSILLAKHLSLNNNSSNFINLLKIIDFLHENKKKRKPPETIVNPKKLLYWMQSKQISLDDYKDLIKILGENNEHLPNLNSVKTLRQLLHSSLSIFLSINPIKIENQKSKNSTKNPTKEISFSINEVKLQSLPLQSNQNQTQTSQIIFTQNSEFNPSSSQNSQFNHSSSQNSQFNNPSSSQNSQFNNISSSQNSQFNPSSSQNSQFNHSSSQNSQFNNTSSQNSQFNPSSQNSHSNLFTKFNYTITRNKYAQKIMEMKPIQFFDNIANVEYYDDKGIDDQKIDLTESEKQNGAIIGKIKNSLILGILTLIFGNFFPKKQKLF